MADQKENKKETVVHTYAEDLAEEIKREQGGAYRIALEEEKRREEEKREFSLFSKQNILFGFLGLCLLALAGAIIFFAFFKNQTATTPPITSLQPKTFLPSATTANVTLGSSAAKEKVITVVKEESLKNREENNILGFNFTEEKNVLETAGEIINAPVNLRRFLFILEIKMPELLLKSLSEEFLLGLYKNEPFLILKIDAFNNAFRGVREWEKTMPDNLAQLFDLDLLKIDPEKAVFEDALIKNRSARILRGVNGEDFLLYGLKGEWFIIIGKSQEMLFEISSRLVL